MCWFCVVAEDDAAPLRRRAGAYGPLPRQAGWLSPDRYDEWPAGPSPMNDEPTDAATVVRQTLDADPLRGRPEN